MIENIFIILLLTQLSILLFTNLFYFYFSSKKRQNFRNNIEPKFSVALVIPCFNEEEVIERKLNNSFNITHTQGSVTIYVIDDGSTDNSINIANNFKLFNNAENLQIWRYPGKKGKARALNWAFKKIRENIIIVTDVDVILDKNALVNLIVKFNDPTVGAITGKILINNQDKKITANMENSYRRIYDVWRRAETNLHSCSVYNGPLMAFRKKVLDNVKINENTYSDDIDLLFKTIRLGYRAIYEPSAKFYESVAPSFLEQMKRKIRRASGLTHTLLENLNMLGRYGSFGKVIFPISLCVHIFFPILTFISLLFIPLIVFRYPILLLLFLSFLVPALRVSFIGFITSQLALVIGLFMPRKGRWKTVRDNSENK